MNKVIFDCDNTMGLYGRDVDDGLALLYLMGRKDVEILGLTTTYGNDNVDKVYENTVRMFDELKIDSIPLLKGAGSLHNRKSPAAQFLAQKAEENPKELIILATGALTNLYGAYEVDDNFFNNLKEIILMGGITEPLIINGSNLDELNFSCDPEATFKVLNSGCKITVLTGHICLQAFFGEEELNRLRACYNNKICEYIERNITPWYEFVNESFGMKGFYNWDVVAAVYLTNQELFEDNLQVISSTIEDLEKGYLRVSKDTNGNEINIPRNIYDIGKFKDYVFEAWMNIRNMVI